MKHNRMWYLAAILLLTVSAVIGCTHHGAGWGQPSGYGGQTGYGVPAPGTFAPQGGYNGGPYGSPGVAPGTGTFAPPGTAPYQPPRGSGLF
jgi:hypothetical protein